MGRGKAVVRVPRSLAVVEVPSPDMVSGACREPVGGLGDEREDYIDAV